jgi:carbon-monoxide dehydrogenase medium subunit
MSFEFHQPTSLPQAVALGERYGADGRFIAGGTDLVIQMNRRRLAPGHLVNLKGLSGLAYIERTEDGYAIGGLTKLKTIERFPAFQTQLASLSEAARVIGGHQVRNIGTIGGNIANASPAADAIVPLLSLDADVVLVGTAGERKLALRDFLKGPGVTERRFDEVLTRIEFTARDAATGTAFLKAGRRRAMEISVVSVAGSVTLGVDGACTNVAIALGAVGPTALRCTTAERLLLGQRPSAELIRSVAKTAVVEAAPITDVRASTRYRLVLVEALVERALHICLARVGGAS